MNMKIPELISPLLAMSLVLGCASIHDHQPVRDHFYRTISFPDVSLKSEDNERIESVEVVMHCGRFAAINYIPNDWSAKVISPMSEETKMIMEAGHGISTLWHSSDLTKFITILVVEPECFDIKASFVSSYFDGEEHSRTVSFKESDLIIENLPNQAMQQRR